MLVTTHPSGADPRGALVPHPTGTVDDPCARTGPSTWRGLARTGACRSVPAVALPWPPWTSRDV